MIPIDDPKNCCGCGACAQICPKSCITMTADREGFAYPLVDTRQCVDCGLCVRTCPMNLAEASGDLPHAWAAQALEDELRLASSSGGIFSLLAEEVLHQGGLVFGAVFGKDFSVHHEQIREEGQLYRLRGSKYVQSSTEMTFREVREALESGCPVLYSGVACQISALNAFLKKDYPQLLTVDVLCHGVPSPKIWQLYLRRQEARFGSRVSRVSFRCKDTGWNGYSMRLEFENGEEYCRPHSQDPYMRYFLNDICLRPSCYRCKFKALPRSSDITLGDAWGIGQYMPELDDDRGTSVIFANTEKGAGYLAGIGSRMALRQGEVDRLLPPEADSRRSVSMHPRRKEFFAAAEAGAELEELEEILRKTLWQKALSFGMRAARRLVKH